MTNQSLEEYKKDMLMKRQVRDMALSILQKAKAAGIPEKHMRIPKSEFVKLLSPRFHGKNSDSLFANSSPRFDIDSFDNVDYYISHPFILIDGGNEESRKLAGYALMFRLIAFYLTGYCQNCQEMVENLKQAFNEFGGFTNRIDYVAYLKKSESLFISEFKKKLFSPHFDTGNFFDNIFSSRADQNFPTIISFRNPIASTSDAREIKEDFCGEYFYRFAESGVKSYQDILRIRLKD